MAEKALKHVSKGRVLDVGCAYGFMLKRFAGNFELYGIDVSEHAIITARKNLPEAELAVHNAEEEFPFEKASFDLVMMHDVLEHVEKPEQVIKNIKTAVKTGGFLYISTPNLNTIRKVIYHFPDKAENHISLFRHEELIKMLEKNGFDTVEAWTFIIPFLPKLTATPRIGTQSAIICKKKVNEQCFP